MNSESNLLILVKPVKIYESSRIVWVGAGRGAGGSRRDI